MTITMKRIESGHYRTPDGKWNVLRIDHWTTCENPHPDHSGYCYGGEQHPCTSWIIEDADGQEHGGAFDTKREATAALERLSWLPRYGIV